jgi:tetratricopeptide (TPR) repeat protein
MICLLAFALPMYAGSIDKQIIETIFSGNTALADSIINAQIEKDPDNPKYYFMKTNYNFYMRYFAQRQIPRDSILQVVVDNGLKTVELGEAQDEPDIDTRFFIGSAYGMLSRAYVMQGEIWDGYWAARDCRNYLHDVLDDDPDYFDAYVGLGVLEYYPAQLTGWMSFLAWLGGMSGESETGLEYWKKTAENGNLLKDEADFILATMYRFLEIDFNNAEIYLTRLNEKFPNNNFITNLYGQTRLAKLIEDKGIDFLHQELDSLRVEYNVNNSGVLNIMGYNFSGQAKYDLAIALFEMNIELYPDEANPYDSISECYQTMGNNEKAVEYAKIGLQKLSADSTINEDFRSRLKEIMETRVEDLKGNTTNM